jgi:hypothetical protein
VDVIVAVVAAPTAVADVPIAVQIVVVIAARVQAAHDSNAVPAVRVARAMIAVIAIPARRDARSSSAKC